MAKSTDETNNDDHPIEDSPREGSTKADAATDEKSSPAAARGSEKKEKATGSKSARKRSGDPRRRASADSEDASEAKAEKVRLKAQKVGNPSWFVPVMLGLMLIGLVWVVAFYVTDYRYPIESWGRWNLGAGFAFILTGFAMTTRWK